MAILLLGWIPERPLRRLAERELRAALGPGARLGRLRVQPARLRAEVQDLVLEGAGYRLEAPRVRLQLAFATLVGRGLVLRSLELDRPRIELRPAPAGAPGAPPALPLVIEDLRVRDASVRYDDPALGRGVGLRGVDVEGGLGHGTLAISVPDLGWGPPAPARWATAAARLRISPRLDVEVDSCELRHGARTTLSASGRLARAGQRDLDLRLTVRAELGEVSHLFSGPSLAGEVAGTATLTGRDPALRLDGHLAGSGLVLAGWPVETLALDLTREGGATTASLVAGLLGGRAEARARLDGSRIDARASARAIDVARLRARLAEAGPPVRGTLSAEVSARGDLEGRLDSQASLTANGRVAGATLLLLADAGGTIHPAGRAVDLRWTAALQGEGTPGGPPPGGPPRFEAGRVALKGTARGALPPAIEGVVEGNLALATSGGRAQVTLGGTLHSRADQASVALEAGALGGSLSLAAEAKGASLRKLSLRGEGLRLETLLAALSGQADFALETRAGSPITGRLHLDDLGWRGARLGSVGLVGERRGARTELRLEAPELQLAAEGELLLGAHPRLAASFTLEDSPLAPLAALLPSGRALAGLAAGTVDLALPLDHPEEAEARAQLSRLEVRSGRVSLRATRPFAATVRRSGLALEGLRLEGDGVALTADGSVGAAGAAPLALHSTVAVDLGRLPLPEGWTLSGSARAEVRLAGDLDHPQATGGVTLERLEAAGPRLPTLAVADGRIGLDGRAASLEELTATLAGGTLTASGRVPLAAVWPRARSGTGTLGPEEQARLRLWWQGISAQELLARLQRGGPGELFGTLAGELRVDGGLASLDELRAGLELPATSLRFGDLSLQADPLAATLEHGRVRADAITVRSAGGSFRASVDADLHQRRLDLSSQGTLDLRALSALLGAAALTGAAEVDLSVKGPFAAPRPKGTLTVRDVTLRVRDIPQALTGLSGRVVFDETALRIEEASAVLGGGPVRLSGGAALDGLALADVRLTVSGRQMALRYPPGLKSRVNAELALKGRSGALRLAGNAEVVRGLFDLDIAVQQALQAAPAAAPSPLLRAIALDLEVDLANPIRVHNNLADLRAGGRIVLRGTLEKPEPYGRLELEPGGRVYLQGRDFRIESGRLDYSGNWNPRLSVDAASAELIEDAKDRSRYRVGISYAGDLETLAPQKIRLTADPPALSEQQIRTLIATGDSSKGLGVASLAGAQAASLVTTRLGREVSRGLSSLGLGQVNVRPELLARETDPGARFTFETQLTGIARLIYSLGLNDTEQRFLQLQLAPGWNVTLLLQRAEDGTFTYGAGQRLLGGPGRRKSVAEERTRLASVRFEGDRPLPEEELRGALHARPGREVSEWDLQDDADRLRERLRGAGYLEAEVAGRLEGDAAVFSIRSGPTYTWRVEGMSDPPDLARAVGGALFEEEALDRGREQLLEVARGRGYLRARVAAQVRDEGGGRVLDFVVERGSSFSGADVSFPGASALPTGRLLRAAGGVGALLTSPQDAVAKVRAEYRAAHYLAAEVGEPQLQEEGGRLRIVVGVREGTPARLAAVRFEGATLPEAELAGVAGLSPGSPFSEEAVAAAAERLRGHYLSLGHPDVRVEAELLEEKADLAAVFQVSEGARVTIGSVEIAGLTRTRPSLFRRQLGVAPGDPLDPRRLAAAERRLLDFGFSRAVITWSDGNPATLKVELKEGPRLAAGYEFRYNDEDKGTALVDAELRDLLGRGVAAGGRYRVGADIREARGSLHVPFVLGGNLTASVFRIDEDLPAADQASGTQNSRRRIGLRLEDHRRLPNHWELLSSYSFKRTALESPFFVQPIVERTAGLGGSLIRDTRDDPLDARRGRFWSVNLELSPKALASDLTFVKGFAQVFVMRAAGPSWTWAQGYRLGLAHGFGGQTLVSDDRFGAGGADSIRGFGAGEVGPRDVFGDPEKGQAVVILNQELRYRHASGLGAVVFYDGGNVFSTVGEMSLSLRHSLGLGLRYASPVGLLRLDVGFPLERKVFEVFDLEGGHLEREKAYHVYFSLGQAF